LLFLPLARRRARPAAAPARRCGTRVPRRPAPRTAPRRRPGSAALASDPDHDVDAAGIAPALGRIAAGDTGGTERFHANLLGRHTTIEEVAADGLGAGGGERRRAFLVGGGVARDLDPHDPARLVHVGDDRVEGGRRVGPYPRAALV